MRLEINGHKYEPTYDGKLVTMNGPAVKVGESYWMDGIVSGDGKSQLLEVASKINTKKWVLIAVADNVERG